MLPHQLFQQHDLCFLLLSLRLLLLPSPCLLLRPRLLLSLRLLFGFSLIFGGVVLARMRALLADVQAEARLRRRAVEDTF